ncbi:MAG TPA: hypothetical protein VGM62_00500 [Chthoniobacterales bacterium]
MKICVLASTALATASVAKMLQGSSLRRDTATSMRDARAPQTQKIVSSFVFIRG